MEPSFVYIADISKIFCSVVPLFHVCVCVFVIHSVSSQIVHYDSLLSRYHYRYRSQKQL